MKKEGKSKERMFWVYWSMLGKVKVKAKNEENARDKVENMNKLIERSTIGEFKINEVCEED